MNFNDLEQTVNKIADYFKLNVKLINLDNQNNTTNKTNDINDDSDVVDVNDEDSDVEDDVEDVNDDSDEETEDDMFPDEDKNKNRTTKVNYKFIAEEIMNDSKNNFMKKSSKIRK